MNRNMHPAIALAICLCSIPTLANAQTTDLATGGAEVIWTGTTASQHAGVFLDQGSVSTSDLRRDLIIGAPSSTDIGKVFVIFGGPVPVGTVSLTHANVVLSGAVAGDGFGSVTANGNVLNVEGSNNKTLIVAAPNASSGRGAVYVFATAFNGGESLTTSSAAFSVTGAAGDRLGASLATADIDGDGYRDIVMGAPGNGRVYVIYGSPSLSGSRDLSTTAADIRISGSGLGSVLTAADVSKDTHYDLLIGAPSLNLTYLIKGRTSRNFPSEMVLSRDEDAYFVGVGNDRAGSSIRVGDFDGDGSADIAIGAPDADGGAGAIYVLWGRTSWASMGLSTADVTFLGPTAGGHAGAVLTGGDINRDFPDDLAVLVSGGSGNPDRVLAYYGRARSSIGFVNGGGTRTVDLANPANISREILGDGSAGMIARLLIYELTGEGARDILASTPDATVSPNTLAGRVYAVTSPKMTLTPAPMSIFTTSGAVSAPATLTIGNASSLGITWKAVPSAGWLGTSPTTGSAIDVTPGQTGITAAALAPGVYTGSVSVSSTSPHLEMTLSVPVTVTAVSRPTVTVSTAFPAAAGSPITWTAASTAGAAAVQYQFWRNDPGVGWHMVRDYSPGSTYTWTPGLGDAGQHFLQVWARATNSPNRYDAYYASDAFIIVRPTAAIAAFSADVVFPQPTGSVVHWSASATPLGSTEYKFWLYKEGSGWSVLQDYSTSGQVTWTPGATGTYAVQVWARVAGTSVNYDDWRSSGMFTITNTAPLQLVSFTSNPAKTPYLAGIPITWSASASGGSAGPLQYRFWRYDQSANAWSIVQDYSAASTYTWTPVDSGDVGTHAIQVWVRSAGSSATYEAWQTTGYFAVNRNPVSSVSVTSDAVFPVPSGSIVHWTAAASGGISPQYKFWIFRDGAGWSVLRDWASPSTVTWTPAQDGQYALQVWARSNGSSVNYDTWISTGTFTVGASGPAAIARFQANAPLPADPGTTITWTATASGGTAGPLQFKFWRLNQQTGAWAVVQDYSASNTLTWTPSSSDSGGYALQVWVRSAGATANYEGWAGTGTFTIR
jgi:hypothetical protein